MVDVSELPPCCECGAKCQVEVFEGTHIQGRATIWLCSAHQLLGGKCPSDTAYLTQDAWLTAMYSAREVDAQAIGQIKHDLIAARDRLNRAIEELIDSEVAAIAAMGEGDVR